MILLDNKSEAFYDTPQNQYYIKEIYLVREENETVYNLMLPDIGIIPDNKIIFTNNLDKYKLKRPKNCKHHILVCHDMIMPEGDYPYEYISQEWIADNADYDAVFWGHIHHDLGTRKVRNTLFTSAGSLVRISRSTENRNRQMRVAILNVEETLSVDFATLTSARSFDDVFIFNEFSTKGKEKYSEYIDKIASFQLDSIDIDTYLTNLQESDTLKNKVREYIYA